MSRLPDFDNYLEQFNHQTTSNMPLGTIEKIEMLYDHIPLVDYALNSLPPFIDRLNSLKNIFYESSSFTTMLESVILDQESINQTLNIQQHQLIKVCLEIHFLTSYIYNYEFIFPRLRLY